ncbi:hypothetical protein GGI35DRAFT_477338 [Trichoderma velutinum]
MSVQWEVTKLTIETSTPDHVTDTLFANGSMQVPVIVSIRAEDPETRETFTLSQSQLESIELVDYYNPASPPPGLSKGDPSAELQKIRYWISSTKVENVNLAAKTRQGNGADLDTSGKYLGYDSHVTLTAVSPVRYRVIDLTTEKVEVKSGVLDTVPAQPRMDWAQYNYYVTSKGHAFLKSRSHNTNTGDRDPAQKDCYLWTTNVMGHVIFFHYAWTMGPPTKQRVGLANGNHGIKGLDVQIDIRQRANAVNFTLMTLWGDNSRWLYGDSFKCEDRWTEVWDIYGNRSTFRQFWNVERPDEIMFQDYDGPANSDANPTPDDGAEPDA